MDSQIQAQCLKMTKNVSFFKKLSKKLHFFRFSEKKWKNVILFLLGQGADYLSLQFLQYPVQSSIESSIYGTCWLGYILSMKSLATQSFCSLWDVDGLCARFKGQFGAKNEFFWTTINRTLNPYRKNLSSSRDGYG